MWKGIRGKPGVRGQPGHLIVNFCVLKSKKIQVIEIGESFSFVIRTENLNGQVNLRTNNIEIHQMNNNVDKLELESLLVSVFSIAVMHVMLQPIAKKLKIGNKPVNTLDLNDYYMLNSVRSFDSSVYYSSAFVSNYDGCTHNVHSHDCVNSHDHIPDDISVNGPDDGGDGGGGCGGCGGQLFKN